MNPKSDVDAKHAFVAELLRRGYDDARVTRSPADITARRGKDTYYFEVKFTAQEAQYFGAATLTEWEAALEHEGRYWFVVACKRNGVWIFHEYSPTEFLEFSSIPPFKIFFNIGVGHYKAVQIQRETKRVRLTRERISQMVELFKLFRTGGATNPNTTGDTELHDRVAIPLE
jgi:hypothetical protein